MFSGVWRREASKSKRLLPSLEEEGQIEWLDIEVWGKKCVQMRPYLEPINSSKLCAIDYHSPII
jgi:hypothetical protein